MDSGIVLLVITDGAGPLLSESANNALQDVTSAMTKEFVLSAWILST